MERVAGFEATAEELARLGLGRSRVDRRPLRRELRPARPGKERAAQDPAAGGAGYAKPRDPNAAD